MNGQAVMMTLLICFLMLPVWSLFRMHNAGITHLKWRDVGWLVGYFFIGFNVLYNVRPFLLGF